MLQLVGDLVEAVVGPLAGVGGVGRQRQVDDRDVVDAAADDQRLGDSLGQRDDVGADLLVDAQERDVLVGADQEARGDDDLVVLGLRIDVLDAVDALDDVLERPGDEFDRVLGLVAVGVTMMSTIGTLICGSSSRGSETRASAPAASAASSSSGVSGELMNARVSAPERPRFMARPARRRRRGRRESRSPSSRRSPGWTTISAPSASLDVVDAGAAEDEAGGHDDDAPRAGRHTDQRAFADEIVAEPVDLRRRR